MPTTYVSSPPVGMICFIISSGFWTDVKFKNSLELFKEITVLSLPFLIRFSIVWQNSFDYVINLATSFFLSNVFLKFLDARVDSSMLFSFSNAYLLLETYLFDEGGCFYYSSIKKLINSILRINNRFVKLLIIWIIKEE